VPDAEVSMVISGPMVTPVSSLILGGSDAMTRSPKRLPARRPAAGSGPTGSTSPTGRARRGELMRRCGRCAWQWGPGGSASARRRRLDAWTTAGHLPERAGIRAPRSEHGPTSWRWWSCPMPARSASSVAVNVASGRDHRPPRAVFEAHGDARLRSPSCTGGRHNGQLEINAPNRGGWIHGHAAGRARPGPARRTSTSSSRRTVTPTSPRLSGPSASIGSTATGCLAW
jgi:hypothetical protein